MRHVFPVRLMISTEDGALPLTDQRAEIPLPRGPLPSTPVLHYGPYLSSLARFFAEGDYALLRGSLSTLLQKPVFMEDITSMEIISEKHGAYYHVARIRVTLLETVCFLGVNVAVTSPQHVAMEREFQVLTELRDRFQLPYLPRPFLTGEAPYSDPFQGNSKSNLLKLLVVEWFEGYHEFHLSINNRSTTPEVKVWEIHEKGEFLDAEETRSLYHQSAYILTSYLDDTSFRHIYPWHHGSGDFVVLRTADGPRVRLITARDYRPVAAWSSESKDPWVAALHFFFTLTVRMRLDRLDGTGPLTWAPAESLTGVLTGFFAAWSKKAESNRTLPPHDALLNLFCHMSPGEWLSFGEVILEDCAVEEEELPFLGARMEEHAAALVKTLKDNFRRDPA
jgi:hypothetical protein